MRRLLGVAAIVHLVLFILRLFGEVEALEDFWFSVAGRISVGVTTLLGIWAAIYFAVDAFRRQYHENRELAIAIAVVGVLSFGLVTSVYYLIWGRHPPEIEYGFDFCDRCLEESEEFPQQISLLTVNFVNGGRLIGNSEPCPECGSVIRTHAFFVFGIPLSSHGSFRVLVPARDRFLLRKRAFYLPHLFPILLIPACIIGMVVAIAVAGK